ncbi:MAG TPA: RDD family protein [Chitinophagaceae bacterium]|nr:RDD family protein [Chitinophagaceae bacterium]MCB9056008.1 RDD family protein [Chitinophagales bacterium]HPG11719.1 RDD family protein [Chitinophagaceae bacterium]
MAVVKVPTNFNIDVEFEIPEFYRRFLSLLIDFLILFFYYKIIAAILSSVFNNADLLDIDKQYDMQWVVIVLVMGPILCYHLLMEVATSGQSVGKKITSLRVVDENGGKASLSQYMIRWLLREIWFIIILLISFSHEYAGNKAESTFLLIVVIAYFFTDIALVVSSKKGQRLGDLLAKTIVIRINKDEKIEDTVFMEVADDYKPQFPQIMQLSDKDINAIKSILETARKKGDFAMAEAAAVKIKTHLKIETDMSPFDFLDVLLKDYNYLSVK